MTDDALRVGQSGRPLRPPSEPCVKVSLHTAQAFLRAYPVWHAPVNSKSSHLCHTHRRPNCAALLTPTLRRTNRLASIIICFSQFKRFHRFSDNERPDRRGHIRSITERLWLVRSSPCRLSWACLAVGLPWTSQGGMTLTAFPCSTFVTGRVRSTLYTGGATFASDYR